MKSPDKNQFEQNAHAFNKKLAIFVGADILLLVLATIAFVVVLTKSSDLSSQVQDVISAQEDEKKPNSNTTIEQDNQGLDIIQKDDDESGITDQDPPKTPATEKPNVDTPVISTPKPVTKPETKPGTTPSQTPTTPTKPTTTPSEPEVVTPPADVNNDFRKSLESKYGIKIAYGNELAGYKPKNKSTTPLTDVVQICTQLNTLDSALAKYPAGFFAEPTETKLTFYFIKSVEDNAFAGLTDHEFGDDVKITLAVNSGFSAYTIHHEIMHWIDFIMSVKAYPTDIYASYQLLNPSDFTYGQINSSLSYYKNAPIPYFMTDYAQTNVLEDRAETFSMMIGRSYALHGMFDQGSVLREKAKIISTQISQYFKTAPAGGNYTWNQFIK